MLLLRNLQRLVQIHECLLHIFPTLRLRYMTIDLGNHRAFAFGRRLDSLRCGGVCGIRGIRGGERNTDDKSKTNFH
ncbi:hypothetical protein WT94_30570 [Burkholderia stagnalis]|nr:hypothetical protein WT76_24625 [Burkholderia stagnalis]KWO33026.1 hypothetical protein WT94_30570 [Burkholderia stagnalis]